ncbi:hypothetical protein Ahy_A03g014561 isoform A [Arachis hypogaea]|uniref:Longin domain-containing protein n=2 Tax=Arachis hypogaea TaxID=3818 RepID=A0A445DYC6_ARAHY|nr:hypothetical protein Ahy_A03g014561 isoform A [Arachis hypogaea]
MGELSALAKRWQRNYGKWSDIVSRGGRRRKVVCNLPRIPFLFFYTVAPSFADSIIGIQERNKKETETFVRANRARKNSETEAVGRERERERERDMKITSLLVLKCSGEGSDPVILANASDVSHFGYFQRSSVKEFIVFVGRTVAKRTPQGQRQSVQHEEYKVHAYNRNGLCAVGFMDDHYPIRSAFSLLNQVLDEYNKKFGESWRSAQTDSTQPWPYLDEALTKFQACKYLFVILASQRIDITNFI